jgi:hypothetical protein
MEHVLFRLHARLLQTTGRIAGKTVRRALEFFVLSCALGSVTTLCILHFTYITSSRLSSHNCLLRSLSVQQKYRDFGEFSATLPHDLMTISLNYSKRGFEANEHNDFHEAFRVYKFSFERGLLMMNNPTMVTHNFTHLDITLDVMNDDCMISPWISSLLQKLVGFDVIVMNWVIATFHGRGFFYNVGTKEMFNLNYAGDFASKKGIVFLDTGRNMHVYSEEVRNSIFVGGFMPTGLYILYDVGSHIATIFVWALKFGVRLFSTGRTWSADSIDSFMRDFQCIALGGGHSTIVNLVLDSFWLVLGQLQQFAAFRVGVLFSTVFLFIITTTLVSHTLRETQERMLRFTYLLQYHVTHRISIDWLVLTHVLESLVCVPIMVGMYFFLFEFFSDQLVRFLF